MSDYWVQLFPYVVGYYVSIGLMIISVIIMLRRLDLDNDRSGAKFFLLLVLGLGACGIAVVPNIVIWKIMYPIATETWLPATNCSVFGVSIQIPSYAQSVASFSMNIDPLDFIYSSDIRSSFVMWASVDADNSWVTPGINNGYPYNPVRPSDGPDFPRPWASMPVTVKDSFGRHAPYLQYKINQTFDTCVYRCPSDITEIPPLLPDSVLTCQVLVPPRTRPYMDIDNMQIFMLFMIGLGLIIMSFCATPLVTLICMIIVVGISLTGGGVGSVVIGFMGLFAILSLPWWISYDYKTEVLFLMSTAFLVAGATSPQFNMSLIAVWTILMMSIGFVNQNPHPVFRDMADRIKNEWSRRCQLRQENKIHDILNEARKYNLDVRLPIEGYAPHTNMSFPLQT